MIDLILVAPVSICLVCCLCNAVLEQLSGMLDLKQSRSFWGDEHLVPEVLARAHAEI